MKKISVSDLSGLNKMGAGVSPAQCANVNANVNSSVGMAPRAASANSSDDDEPPVKTLYGGEAVVYAEYYRPSEPEKEEPEPSYGEGGGGGGPEWPNEGFSYNSYSGYSQAYGYYGYGSDQTVDPDPEPQPNPNPDPEPKPQPTKPDWKTSTRSAKIAAILNALKNAYSSIDIRQIFSNFPKYEEGAFVKFQANVIINGVSIPVCISFMVDDEMVFSSGIQPRKLVINASAYDPANGVQISGNWYRYDLVHPDAVTATPRGDIMVPYEHGDTFDNFFK